MINCLIHKYRMLSEKGCQSMWWPGLSICEEVACKALISRRLKIMEKDTRRDSTNSKLISYLGRQWRISFRCAIKTYITIIRYSCCWNCVFWHFFFFFLGFELWFSFILGTVRNFTWFCITNLESLVSVLRTHYIPHYLYNWLIDY